jgi:hypothetical protein
MATVSKKTRKIWARRFVTGAAVFAVAWMFSGKLFLHIRPDNVENICAIFDDRYSWYRAAKASEERWGTPKHVQMAIVRQESSFIFNARPPRTKLMGFIPWKRPSNAYGFAQALDNTWQWYLDDTDREYANRDEFEDAIDFVGWYTHQSNRIVGISKWDPYNQYLAYHEGQGGWREKTFEQKAWLKKKAKQVDKRAREWWVQLQHCEEDLDNRWWLLRRLLS